MDPRGAVSARTPSSSVVPAAGAAAVTAAAKTCHVAHDTYPLGTAGGVPGTMTRPLSMFLARVAIAIATEIESDRVAAAHGAPAMQFVPMFAMLRAAPDTLFCYTGGTRGPARATDRPLAIIGSFRDGDPTDA